MPEGTTTPSATPQPSVQDSSVYARMEDWRENIGATVKLSGRFTDSVGPSLERVAIECKDPVRERPKRGQRSVSPRRGRDRSGSENSRSASRRRRRDRGNSSAPMGVDEGANTRAASEPARQSADPAVPEQEDKAAPLASARNEEAAAGQPSEPARNEAAENDGQPKLSRKEKSRQWWKEHCRRGRRDRKARATKKACCSSLVFLCFSLVLLGFPCFFQCGGCFWRAAAAVQAWFSLGFLGFPWFAWLSIGFPWFPLFFLGFRS